MAIQSFKCAKCGEIKETLKKAPEHCDSPMERQLSAPSLKFMEPRHKEKGASVLKDQDKLLKDRAREHARLNDWHDLTQENNLDMAKRQGWLNEHGTIKKKIDTT